MDVQQSTETITIIKLDSRELKLLRASLRFTQSRPESAAAPWRYVDAVELESFVTALLAEATL